MSLKTLLDSWNHSPLSFHPVKVNGITFFSCSFDRLLYLWLQKCGLMGRDDREVFARLVRPGMRVIDVGANLGIVSMALSRFAGPNGHVYAYEPVEALRRSLEAALTANQVTNITVLPVAAGSSHGKVSMTLHCLNSGDNRAQRNPAKTGSLAIPVERIDTRFADQTIDFVKIDVQGFEPEVLAGMTGLLHSAKPPLIYFELSRGLLAKNSFSVLDTLEPLLACRYTFAVWDARSRSFSPIGVEDVLQKARKTHYFNVLASPAGMAMVSD